MLKAFACLAGRCLGPRSTRIGDPARRTHFPNAATRGEAGKENGKQGRDFHESLFVQGAGRRAIYPDIKRAPASRREARVVELVPRLAWQHCEVWFYLLMKRLRNNRILGPRTAAIVGQMTDKATALCMSWNRGFPHRTSACRTVRNKSQQDRLTPCPPRCMPPRAAPRRTPHSWQ